MSKLGRGLIGAAAGFGVGMEAVAKDQLEKNKELAKVLRNEAFTASENTKTRELTASEGLANRTAKTEDLKKELESKEKIASEVADLKKELLATTNETKIMQIKNELALKEQQLTIAGQIADMKVTYAQGLLSIGQQKADTADRKVDAGKESSPTEKAKARKEAITEAQGYIDSGDTQTAQTILSAFGLTLQEETVPGKKNLIFPNEKDTKKWHIVDAVSAASPAGSTPVPGKGDPGSVLGSGGADPDKQILDSILAKKPKTDTSGSTVTQKSGMIGSGMPKQTVIPENLPANLNDLDSMANSLPVEMDGIYKKSPSWERGRNISEGISSVTGQSQATQNSAILRRGEDNLTKAIRIATGKTDIYELNIIADKLKTVYKGKLSDAQLATLIDEGKILGGNKTGA